MGTSTSKPSKTPESSRELQKALKLFQKLERSQTKFFCGDAFFSQNNVVVEQIVKEHLGLVENSFVVHIEPQNDKPAFTMSLSPELLRAIKLWLYSPSIGAQFLCNQVIHSVGHTVLIILKKRAKGIDVLYMDPYNFPLKQSYLLSALLQVHGGVTTVPVTMSLRSRDTEHALWYTLGRESFHVTKELWPLYLFYKAHNLLSNYKQIIGNAGKVYDKLVRLLPQLQSQGFLF